MNTSYASYATSICKTIKSIGIVQKGLYIPILNEVLRLIEKSGPEYLLGRLSSLSEWRKQHVSGNTEYSEPWFKNKTVFSKKEGKTFRIPTDPLGSRLWRFRDKSFFALVGGMRKSISFSKPTYKQLWKWLSGVRCQLECDLLNRENPLKTPKERQEALYLFLNDRLKFYNSRLGPFLPKHITGISIPIGAKSVNILAKDRRNKDPSKLMHAYLGSIQTAPITSHQFYMNLTEKFTGVKLDMISNFSIERYHTNQMDPERPYHSYDKDDLDQSLIPTTTYRGKLTRGLNPTTKVGKRLASKVMSEGMLDLNCPHALRDPPFWNPATLTEFSWSLDHEDLDRVDFLSSREIMLAGSIGFIQEKAGKLRTIANPNRFVQYLLTPLGQAFDDWQNSYVGCFVYDQEAGKDRVQTYLRSGSKLAAFDLTSATDYLDYQSFLIDMLGCCAPRSVGFDMSTFHEGLCDYEDIPKYVIENPELDFSLGYFSHISNGFWKLPTEFARDTLGSRTDYLQWSVGQPLGLRPSFPLLTVMNCQIAESSCRQYWDDFIENLKQQSIWKAVKDALYRSFPGDPYPSDPDSRSQIRFNLFCDTGRWFDDAECKFLSYFLRPEWRKDIPKHDIYRYVCVGDDMVIDYRFSTYYVSLIEKYNGKISVEKGMISNKAIEFCSTIITRDDQYPLKPSFLEGISGSIQNIQRFSLGELSPRVPKWVLTLHDNVAKLGIPGLTKSGLSRPSSGGPKPLAERLFGYFLTEVSQKPRRDDEVVSFNTFFERSLSNPKLASWWSRHIFSEPSPDPYEDWRLCGFDKPPVPYFRGNPTVRDLHFLSQHDVDLSFPLSWDYRKGTYSKPESVLSLCKSLEKIGSSVEWLSSESDDVALLRATIGESTFTFMVPNDPNHILSGRAIDDIVMTVEGSGTKSVTLDPTLYTGQYSYWTGGNLRRVATEQQVQSFERVESLARARGNSFDDYTR